MASAWGQGHIVQDEPIDEPPAEPIPLSATNPVPVVMPPPTMADVEPHPDAAANETSTHPAWADDLRKLYDSVVEEPLPDSLIDLLSQLNAED